MLYTEEGKADNWITTKRNKIDMKYTELSRMMSSSVDKTLNACNF